MEYIVGGIAGLATFFLLQQKPELIGGSSGSVFEARSPLGNFTVLPVDCNQTLGSLDRLMPGDNSRWSAINSETLGLLQKGQRVIIEILDFGKPVYAGLGQVVEEDTTDVKQTRKMEFLGVETPVKKSFLGKLFADKPKLSLEQQSQLDILNKKFEIISKGLFTPTASPKSSNKTTTKDMIGDPFHNIDSYPGEKLAPSHRTIMTPGIERDMMGAKVLFFSAMIKDMPIPAIIKCQGLKCTRDATFGYPDEEFPFLCQEHAEKMNNSKFNGRLVLSKFPKPCYETDTHEYNALVYIKCSEKNEI